MVEILTFVTSSGQPLTSPATLPQITIRRLDTGVAVVSGSNTTEVGDGLYRFSFTPDPTLEYGVVVDADPLAAGQVTLPERYYSGSVSGIEVARIETDIPAILVDTGTDIPASIGTLDGKVDAVDANVDTLLAAHVRATLTVSAGSSATEVRTGATEADGFHDGALLVVVNVAGVAGRVVRSYANLNGAFTVAALPFTPAASDAAYLLTASMLEVEQIRKITSNRVVVNGTDTQMDVYEDDDVTVAFSLSISADRRDRTPI